MNKLTKAAILAAAGIVATAVGINIGAKKGYEKGSKELDGQVDSALKEFRKKLGLPEVKKAENNAETASKQKK